MTTFTRDELALYVMGEHDDPDAVEEALATDEALREIVADEARLETSTAARCDSCGAASAPGGYVVERVLVASAHGRMYVARDADGRQVALKELAFVHSPTLDVIAAFEREAKFLRALDHPAIPRFVASFEEGTGVHVRYYLAQELVTGVQLDARLADHWCREPEIIAIASQVLEVLVYLQSLSPMVIHRDIKPANLLYRADGSIAVVDFGAAHVQGTTAGSSSLGTFGYMPIEQLAGIVDATTDPYALGASLLHLLTRREPWRILQDAQLDELNVSRGLRAFLGKLVAPEPRHRFANAAAALDALERLKKGPRTMDVVERIAWKRPLAIAAASLALIAGGIGGVAMLRSDDPAPQSAPLDPVASELALTTALVDNTCRCPLGDVACGRRWVKAFNNASRHGSKTKLKRDPGQNHRLDEQIKRMTHCMADAMAPPAILRVELPPGVAGELWIDGVKAATPIVNGHEVQVSAGEHRIEVLGPNATRCAEDGEFTIGKRTTIACTMAPLSPLQKLKLDSRNYDWGDKDATPNPSSALEQLRKTGVAQVPPDEATRVEIERSGRRPILGAFKVCIDDKGAVDMVLAIKSTGFPAYDAHIEREIKTTWSFKPFVLDGKTSGMCTVSAIRY